MSETMRGCFVFIRLSYTDYWLSESCTKLSYTGTYTVSYTESYTFTLGRRTNRAVRLLPHEGIRNASA